MLDKDWTFATLNASLSLPAIELIRDGDTSVLEVETKQTGSIDKSDGSDMFVAVWFAETGAQMGQS